MDYPLLSIRVSQVLYMYQYIPLLPASVKQSVPLCDMLTSYMSMAYLFSFLLAPFQEPFYLPLVVPLNLVPTVLTLLKLDLKVLLLFQDLFIPVFVVLNRGKGSVWAHFSVVRGGSV